MKISVQVNTNSSQQKVIETASGELKINIHVKPIKGEANKIVTQLLAAYYHIPKSQIELISGRTAKLKIFNVNKK